MATVSIRLLNTVHALMDGLESIVLSPAAPRLVACAIDVIQHYI